MTDTIDVAALVEELNAWGPFVASGYECPAASKAMHRAVTALQSQAEQLTEAKSLIGVLQLELGHSGNLIAELTARATTAEASLATMREALEPFALAEPTNIYSGDIEDPDAEVTTLFTENQFRFARKVYEAPALAKEGK